MKYQVMEYIGVALIAGALAWVHPALGAGAVGVYLLTVGILLGGGGDGD